SQESGVSPQEGRLKLEEGRRRTGVEGESFFITLLSGHDITQRHYIAMSAQVFTMSSSKCSLEKVYKR
ncbi:hypothetical protein, partial [Okeania sp. SIO3B5]|uniref:hypothetical protein n=1 Tax=Okeania sp. SIO3B5 TaxID=2607811 RepID=UPI0025ED7A04